MSIIVGIDPGQKGAIAHISTSGRAIAFPMPTLLITKSKRILDEVKICHFLEQRKKSIRHIFIEKVASMHGQGVSSTFTFGTGYGILRGICVGLHLPYTLVHSRTWKRIICMDMPKGSKDVSIIVAKRIWPNTNLCPTPRSKDSDGMADALCIAEYGRRSLLGEIK